MTKTSKVKNPQVNCLSKDCYHNIKGICHRQGIHADEQSCGCYICGNDVERI